MGSLDVKVSLPLGRAMRKCCILLVFGIHFVSWRLLCQSVEEQIKALELSKAAAEDRAIRAEAAATHLMDELQNFSSIGKKLSERSERREVEEILLHARFGRDGRFEGDELAKVRSWIKYLEDLHVADDVARQKNERERENLSAQVRFWSEGQKH